MTIENNFDPEPVEDVEEGEASVDDSGGSSGALSGEALDSEIEFLQGLSDIGASPVIGPYGDE